MCQSIKGKFFRLFIGEVGVSLQMSFHLEFLFELGSYATLFTLLQVVHLEEATLASRWPRLTPVTAAVAVPAGVQGNLKVPIAPAFRLPNNHFPAQAIAGQQPVPKNDLSTPGSPPIITAFELIDTVTDPIDTVTLLTDTVTDPIDTVTLLTDTVTDPINTMTLLIDTVTDPINTVTLLIDTATDPIDTVTLLIDTATDPIDTVTLLIDTAALVSRFETGAR